MTIDQLKQLGRAALIAKAVERIKDPSFRTQAYGRVRVMANSTMLYVTFERPICYLPVGAVRYTSVYVDLQNEYTSGSIESHSHTDKGKAAYYTENENDQAVIQHVYMAYSRFTGCEPDWKMDDRTVMHIREQEDHYYVDVHSEYIMSFYKVKKNTGELYDEGHCHLIPAGRIIPDTDPVIELT